MSEHPVDGNLIYLIHTTIKKLLEQKHLYQSIEVDISHLKESLDGVKSDQAINPLQPSGGVPPTREQLDSATRNKFRHHLEESLNPINS